MGYPTQKPIILLERIIQIATNEGDMVLDPFCGSGTTLVASRLLSRKFIGIDISQEAIELSRDRVNNPIKTESQLLKNGKDSYLTQDEDVLDVLTKMNSIPVWRNKGIDGFLKVNNSFKPIPVKVQRKTETVDDSIRLLLQSCKSNNYLKKILIVRSKDQCSLFSDTTRDTDLQIFYGINDFLKNKNTCF